MSIRKQAERLGLLRCFGHRVLRSSKDQTMVGGDTFWGTSRVASKSLSVWVPFLTSCEAIALADLGQVLVVCLDLPVGLLRVHHDQRLDCEKSKMSSASCQRCCFFLPSLLNEAEAVLRDWEPIGA